MRPVITLLTDFGMADHYVAAMKGVILGIRPDVQLVDISHEIAPFAISEAAYTLAHAWSCFPHGTVHLVVVDPGVGSSRRPILADVDGHFFVAPDNGVLTMVFDAVPGYEVREILADRYFRHPVSRTFHGRDIFAPVAAHVATGEPALNFGPAIDDWIRLPFVTPIRSGPDTWQGQVLKIDRFGNIITSFASKNFGEIAGRSFELHVGRGVTCQYFANYAASPDSGVFVIHGSTGYIEISANQQSAANLLGVTPGAPVQLRYT